MAVVATPVSSHQQFCLRSKFEPKITHNLNTWLSAWFVDAPATSRQVTDHRRRSSSTTATFSPASATLENECTLRKWGECSASQVPQPTCSWGTWLVFSLYTVPHILSTLTEMFFVWLLHFLFVAWVALSYSELHWSGKKELAQLSWQLLCHCTVTRAE